MLVRVEYAYQLVNKNKRERCCDAALLREKLNQQRGVLMLLSTFKMEEGEGRMLTNDISRMLLQY